MLLLHLTILTLTIVVIIFTDIQGLLWMTGKKDRLPKKLFIRLHRIVWMGLLGMITTGVAMAYPYIEYLSVQSLFQGKMFFVVLLVINAYLIGKHMDTAFEKKFAELTKKEKLPLLVSGIISTGSWIGAIVISKILF